MTTSGSNRDRDRIIGSWLSRCGWTAGRDSLWRHPCLTFPWPMLDAARLEGESRKGVPSVMELFEEWPSDYIEWRTA
jgi:hypothetical protein